VSADDAQRDIAAGKFIVKFEQHARAGEVDIWRGRKIADDQTGRRFSLLDSVYGIVLAVALWMTIDLDYPGLGLIRVSNLPIVETLAAMR
jgi:hypothetical protein